MCVGGGEAPLIIVKVDPVPLVYVHTYKDWCGLPICFAGKPCIYNVFNPFVMWVGGARCTHLRDDLYHQICQTLHIVCILNCIIQCKCMHTQCKFWYMATLHDAFCFFLLSVSVPQKKWYSPCFYTKALSLGRRWGQLLILPSCLINTWTAAVNTLRVLQTVDFEWSCACGFQ